MSQPVPIPRELLPECMVHRNHPGLAAWVLQSGKIVWCCEPAWSQLRDREIGEEYKKRRLERLKKETAASEFASEYKSRPTSVMKCPVCGATSTCFNCRDSRA